MSAARDRILGRVRAALAGRDQPAHPGTFVSGRTPKLPEDPVEAFIDVFTHSGGEVLRFADHDALHSWLDEMTRGETVAVGHSVPAAFVPDVTEALPEVATVGLSWARVAAAETGSLLLDARDGRLVQLLPPTHVVILRSSSVKETLVDTLEAVRDDLPSAIGIHSGPSKSADIGQILVKGVHGPGRVIAAIFDE